MKSKNFKIKELEYQINLLKQDSKVIDQECTIDYLLIFKRLFLNYGDNYPYSNKEIENYLSWAKSFSQSELLEIYQGILNSNKGIKVKRFLKFENLLTDESLKLLNPDNLKRVTIRLMKSFPKEFIHLKQEQIIVDIDHAVKVIDNKKINIILSPLSVLFFFISLTSFFAILIFNSIKTDTPSAVLFSLLPTVFSMLFTSAFIDYNIKKKFLNNEKQNLIE
jgi:hypothetical protein